MAHLIATLWLTTIASITIGLPLFAKVTRLMRYSGFVVALTPGFVAYLRYLQIPVELKPTANVWAVGIIITATVVWVAYGALKTLPQNSKE